VNEVNMVIVGIGIRINAYSDIGYDVGIQKVVQFFLRFLNKCYDKLCDYMTCTS